MHHNVKQVVQCLKDANRSGVVRGGVIYLEANGRKVEIYAMDGLYPSWVADDEKIPFHSRSEWQYFLVQDVIAYLDRGEKTYRDLPIRRRR